MSCKGSAVPWTECRDDAVRFESDRNFVVYYVPEGRPGTEKRKSFPGERDRTKREYFTTTSSGIMIQCADPKLATHVKCYAPEVTRLLVDQDVVDETVFYLKGKSRKEIAAAIQQLDSSLSTKVDKSVKAESSPWRRSGVDFLEVFNPGRFVDQCVKHGLRTASTPSFDFQLGWNVFREDHRDYFWKVFLKEEPYFVLLSAECKAFSILMLSNWQKMCPLLAHEIQEAGLDMCFFYHASR